MLFFHLCFANVRLLLATSFPYLIMNGFILQTQRAMHTAGKFSQTVCTAFVLHSKHI